MGRVFARRLRQDYGWSGSELARLVTAGLRVPHPSPEQLGKRYDEGKSQRATAPHGVVSGIVIARSEG
jgi:hypothetical protein